MTSHTMAGFRPRISLLTALLLMTIVGMTIVLVQLWREVGPLRTAIRQLRDETGRLSIDDPQELCAMGVRTNEPLYWKWRVWVPEGAKVTVSAQWGNVPRDGVPAGVPEHGLDPGEQWISMRAMQNPKDGSWFARLETKTWAVQIPINEQDCWWNWPTAGLLIDGVLFETGTQGDEGAPLILTRHRTDHSSGSIQLQKSNAPSAGFIIWLDRQ